MVPTILACQDRLDFQRATRGARAEPRDEMPGVARRLPGVSTAVRRQPGPHERKTRTLMLGESVPPEAFPAD
jgi:hypothetical protein